MSTLTPATLHRAGAVEDFRGDFAELAAVMEASWGENPSTPFLYTPEFLADCFAYPGAGFALAPAIYDDSELAAFVAGFPRRIRFGGEERNVLLVALLTVAQNYKSSGYGIVVWSELMRRASAAGFDGVVNYCVNGEAMDRMIEGCCRRLGIPVARVASFSYLSRLLRPVPRTGLEETAAPTVESFLRATTLDGDASSLARVWSAGEASWQLSRAGAISACGGTEADPAVLAGYVMQLADNRRTGCLIVEDVSWGSLDPAERVKLAQDFTARASAAGAQLAIFPIRGDCDTQPFVETRFRPSGHQIHAYLSIWNGPMPAEPISSYYLDVF